MLIQSLACASHVSIEDQDRLQFLTINRRSNIPEDRTVLRRTLIRVSLINISVKMINVSLTPKLDHPYLIDWSTLLINFGIKTRWLSCDKRTSNLWKNYTNLHRKWGFFCANQSYNINRIISLDQKKIDFLWCYIFLENSLRYILNILYKKEYLDDIYILGDAYLFIFICKCLVFFIVSYNKQKLLTQRLML